MRRERASRPFRASQRHTSKSSKQIMSPTTSLYALPDDVLSTIIQFVESLRCFAELERTCSRIGAVVRRSRSTLVHFKPSAPTILPAESLVGIMRANRLKRIVLCSKEDFLSHTMLLHIADYCPLLEELSLLICHRQGSHNRASAPTALINRRRQASATCADHATHASSPVGFTTPIRSRARRSSSPVSPEYIPISPPDRNSAALAYSSLPSAFSSSPGKTAYASVRQNPNLIDMSSVRMLLSGRPQLKTCVLLSSSISNQELRALLELKQMQKLVIWGLKRTLDPIVLQAFARAFSTSLSTLILQQMNADRSFFEALTQSAHSSSTLMPLSTLHLQNCTGISRSGLDSLARMSNSWQTIELVHTEAVTDSGILHFSTRPHAHPLRHLSLCHTGSEITDHTLERLSKLTKLTTLRLQRYT